MSLSRHFSMNFCGNNKMNSIEKRKIKKKKNERNFTMRLVIQFQLNFNLYTQSNLVISMSNELLNNITTEMIYNKSVHSRIISIGRLMMVWYFKCRSTYHQCWNKSSTCVYASTVYVEVYKFVPRSFEMSKISLWRR